MTVQGIDVSHHNMLPNLTTYGFVFHKATQGAGYVDPTFATRWPFLKELGKVRGAYHFISMNNSAHDQVEHFASVVPVERGDIIALDFETDGTWGNYSRDTIALRGADVMRLLRLKYLNNRIVLYCNRSDYTRYVASGGVQVSVGDGLWIASPGVTPTMPYLFWQYGGTGIDLDHGNFDTLDALKEWANMGSAWEELSDVTAPDGRHYTYGELARWTNVYVNELKDEIPAIAARLDAIEAKLPGVHGTFTITGSGSVG
jgi:hypothetical protein